MRTDQVLGIASQYLSGLPGHTLDILTQSMPGSIEEAVDRTKIISKLSPIVGNSIEFKIVEYLNQCSDLNQFGVWQRQDPGFPDTVFVGNVTPTPGFEVKAWFPLATEITARFKDSQNHFNDDQTYVIMLAWLPEYIVHGKPKIIDMLIVSGASVAKSRDDHYHNPPDYLVLEPEDTSGRTANLQQTNTNGYKFQKEKGGFDLAVQRVAAWGEGGREYKSTSDYQEQIRTLMREFDYRLDTNFAKMDRIRNSAIEQFKTRVHNTPYMGMTVGAWNKLLARGSDEQIATALATHLLIR